VEHAMCVVFVHRAWPWCWMVYVFMTPWALDV
jgi:hypothetical protein